jgi:polyisoprenoid-binding protein YceI
MLDVLAPRPLIAGVALSLALLLTACGGGVPTPTTPPKAAEPTQPATATPASAPPSAPTAPATAPASTPASAAATKPANPANSAPAGTATAAPATAAAPAPAGSIRLTLVKDGSEARYKAREVLVGQTLPNDAIGATRDVAGTIVLGPNGQIVAGQSKVTVDLRTLKSDQGMRDGFLQRSTLNTSQFPNAEFAVKDVEGLPWPLPTSGEARFKLRGDLTLRGVTRPATWDVSATFTPQEVSGRATTVFTMSDFDIPVPRVPRVASIEDQITLEIDFKASRTAG